MKQAKKLSRVERLEISILRDKGHSLRSIAIVMGRSPNTISAEVKRNAVCGTYDPRKAHHKAYVRKKYSRFQWKKVNRNEELRTFITAKLTDHWSPDAIAGYMKRKSFSSRVSKNTIYRWLYSTHGVPYCRYLATKRYRRKKRLTKTARVMIPNRIPLSQRPKGADNRSRYGHWEADTVVSGKRGKGAVCVMIERKSRYVDTRLLGSMRPSETVSVLRDMSDNKKTLSITFDNGIENKYHEQIGVPTFFCDPYASWQKGSVEHANKMLRRYFPKGTDFSHVTDEELARVVARINNTPRKILGYRSPREVALHCGILQE